MPRTRWSRRSTRCCPGIIGDGEGELSLTEIEDAANTVGLIGLVGVLYTGLGWLSALRDALITVFALPEREQPNFVMGKVRDLITLVVLGAVLLVAVAAHRCRRRLLRGPARLGRT